MKQKIKGYISTGVIAGLVGLAFGLLGGTSLGEYLTQPVKAYVRDLNNDGKQDIVVKSREGNSTVFMQEGNGKNWVYYTPLDEYVNERKKEVASNSKLEIKAIENERKSLEVEGMITK